MTEPQPKTKAEEALQAVLKFSPYRRPDAVTIARLKREANRALDVDFVTAQLALCMLSSYSWDEEAVRLHATSALNAARAKRMHLGQINSVISVALQNLELISEAATYAVRAFEQDPLDLESLRNAVLTSAWSGNWAFALELEARHSKLSKSSPINISAIMDSEKVFAEAKVPPDLVREVHDVAYGLLRERRVSSHSYKLLPLNEEGMVMCYIMLDKPSKEILELDAELTERLYGRFDELHVNSLWIGFDRIEHGDRPDSNS